MMQSVVRLVIAVLVLDGCAAPPDEPQTHVGTCSHYQDSNRRLENVPNCLLRSKHTLINGLGPANTQDRS
jgi:hypothetical protein